MSLLLETSVALTRAWCKTYTRGLPEGDRAARRAEIESDLWEHQDDGRIHDAIPVDVGFDILVRFVTGVPADITWRRGARIGRRESSAAFTPRLGKGRKMATRLFVTFSAALAIVLGAFLLLNAVGMFLEGGNDYLPYALSQIVSGAVLIASVPVGARSPRKAAGLVAVAVVLYAVVHIWMVVIVVPLAVILVGGAWLRSRSTPPPVPQA